MGLIDDPRIVKFRHEVDEQIGSLTHYITSGACANHDEYKHKCGQIKGLKMSVNIIADIIKNYGQDDDMDDD